ncbi:hypothetical protein D3C73_1482840 [compost metagenome]
MPQLHAIQMGTSLKVGRERVQHAHRIVQVRQLERSCAYGSQSEGFALAGTAVGRYDRGPVRTGELQKQLAWLLQPNADRYRIDRVYPLDLSVRPAVQGAG